MDLPTPSGPLILMVAVVVVLTLSLPRVCGVLILGTEHPADMADFVTEPTGFCGVPGADVDSKFAGILSAALSQHRLSGLEIAQLEFHHLH